MPAGRGWACDVAESVEREKGQVRSRWDESWIRMFSMSKSIISQVKFQPSHRPRLKKKNWQQLLTCSQVLLLRLVLPTKYPHNSLLSTHRPFYFDFKLLLLFKCVYINYKSFVWPYLAPLWFPSRFLKQLDLTICFHFTTYYSFEKMLNFKIFIQWSKRKLISRRVVLLISKKVSVNPHV